MQERVKILYIAGSGRCGSTVLSQLLGGVEGFVNLGEVRYLFNEKMQKRHLPCSCGEKAETCEFWARYINGIPPKVRLWSTKNLRLLAFPVVILRSRLGVEANLREFFGAVTKLYSEIFADTGGRVFIDASKHPAFAWAMSQVPGVDVYILHLVRDPRDVVGSWSRPKGYLEARFPLRIIEEWFLYNVLIDILFGRSEKYMRLRYEDFAQNPLEGLKRVISFIGEDVRRVESLTCDRERQFRLTEGQHLLAGNPEKMRTSMVVEVRPRTSDVNAFWQVLTVVLCGPWLYKYGYDIVDRGKIGCR